MSTNADYLAAKDAFNGHVETHKCKPQQCPNRLALWQSMMRVAGELGIRTHVGIRL